MTVQLMPAMSLLATVLLASVSCTPAAVGVEPGVSLELARHRAATMSDVNYRLHLRIPENQREDIDGRLAVSFVLNDNSMPLQLDFREHAGNVLRVVTNAAESAYSFEQEHIVIPASELAVGTNLVEIDFTAGSTSLNRNPEYLYTLFVPDRARTAFPLFDQPDLKATYELALDVPAGWTAMSNAPVDSVSDGDGTAGFRFHKTDRISS